MNKYLLGLLSLFFSLLFSSLAIYRFLNNYEYPTTPLKTSLYNIKCSQYSVEKFCCNYDLHYSYKNSTYSHNTQGCFKEYPNNGYIITIIINTENPSQLINNINKFKYDSGLSFLFFIISFLFIVCFYSVSMLIYSEKIQNSYYIIQNNEDY